MLRVLIIPVGIEIAYKEVYSTVVYSLLRCHEDKLNSGRLVTLT